MRTSRTVCRGCPTSPGTSTRRLNPLRCAAWDGTILADWATKRREVLPAKEVPPLLIQAFVAVEDRRFYEHGGLDYRGIMRATLANLRAGAVSQGGSTITQQVAKSFFDTELFFARSFLRKIPEAILARRLEARYSKEEILTLYLNQIFLGQTAYGVAAAARRYFDKTVNELDLGEMATIAGIARAPSRFSPIPNLERAQARRDQVLAAMVAAGHVTAGRGGGVQGQAAGAAPAAGLLPRALALLRRARAALHGQASTATSCCTRAGWRSRPRWCPGSISPPRRTSTSRCASWTSARAGAGRWPGSSGLAAEQFKRKMAERYRNAPPREGRLLPGAGGVQRPQRRPGARWGPQLYFLPSANMNWAYPYSIKDSTNGKTIDNTSNVLRAGDVIWVSNAHQSNRRRFSDWTYDGKNEVQWQQAYKDKEPPNQVTLRLEQTPRVQGAIFSYDHTSGYVTSMVGGADFDRSEFNRVNQACRQPGSTYKPIYYALALEKGYGYESLLNDIPRAEIDPITGEVWIPTNLNNTVEYQVTLEYSLVWSKNVPSVQLFKLVGGREVEGWARKLGMTTKIIPDQALALGASCVRMDELTRAFSAFAKSGVTVDPVYVRRVRDRSGVVLEDNTRRQRSHGAAQPAAGSAGGGGAARSRSRPSTRAPPG